MSGRFMDFGFDIMTTGVGDVTNITALSLYPNPADGRFRISFDARRPVRNIGITVVNTCGQKVSGRHYAGTGSTFMTDIDLEDAPAGVYFVRIDADGEVLTRSVVVK